MDWPIDNLIQSAYRKTKKGSIIKSVREVYLRDDLHCGKESCPYCIKFKLSSGVKFAPNSYLSDSPRIGLNKLCPAAHYIVPDTTALLNQIDIFLEPNFGEDVLILLTVWKAIQSNLNTHAKLKELISTRRFYLFDNEFHRETFRLRNPNETIGKYRNNLCLETIDWLQKHYENGITLVYLTDQDPDKYDQMILANSRIKIYSVSDYVHNFQSNSNLLVDKLTNTSDVPEEKIDANRKFSYKEHLPFLEVLEQIKNGSLYKGVFRSSPYNFLEGSVTVTIKNEECKILVQGRENINRAINEDIVALRILPKSEWHLKTDSVLDENLDGDEDEIESSLQVEQNVPFSEGQQPFGEVVSIIRKSSRSFCGVIKEKQFLSATSTNFLFVPVDKRIPFIQIETRQYEMLRNKKILVNIDAWPCNSKYPKGHYIRIIGESGEKETETDVILLEHLVPHSEFSVQVLNCLPFEGANWKPSSEDLKNRLDLRSECVVSVDPPGCTDIDDALHCKDLENGLYEIGVHIADVSHFIKFGTAIDREAAERGTTVYLADRRIDMIPGFGVNFNLIGYNHSNCLFSETDLLSSNLCSLRQNEERLSFSCIWEINSKTGEIVATKFAKSIIKSQASLTYAEAQIKIDSNDNDAISKSLRRLLSVAKILKAKRIENGALVLASANEIRFMEVESETAENELIILEKKMLETNSMIEEFMLLANISVARKIYEFFPEISVLRRHPKPASSNFEELIQAAKNRGFSMNVSDGKTLSHSLNEAIDPKNEHLNLLLRMITTRCMSQAVYFCSGILSSDPNLTFFHYGLASDIYTHFTSPIRRYADILVHRLLSHCIFFEMQDPEFLSKKKIANVCDHINMRNMNARRASRASNELHSFLYVRNSKKESVQENGHIFIIKNNALVIFILHLSFEVVYMLDPLDSWIIDKDNAFVIHKPTSTKIRQFDQVKVELKVDKKLTSNFKKQIIVKLLHPRIS
ncbi:exosome complex exonuclease RRP44-like protein [Sarcoptes scabiei]|uniref:Protein DIS3 homolog n=1 Tax=Sarcoptes scabiei TaxID=52283 RepID=A0A132AB36_SARSC|nr:exosome complex exonuclease RRP44-like protein [Sarcoptes scabiei]